MSASVDASARTLRWRQPRGRADRRGADRRLEEFAPLRTPPDSRIKRLEQLVFGHRVIPLLQSGRIKQLLCAESAPAAGRYVLTLPLAARQPDYLSQGAIGRRPDQKV